MTIELHVPCKNKLNEHSVHDVSNNLKEWFTLAPTTIVS
jgi:hypothetical protein